MTTAIRAAKKEGGFVNLKFMTQQYEVGLYIAIYTCDENWNTVGTPDQDTSQKTEKAYHKTLRAKAGKEFVKKQSTLL